MEEQKETRLPVEIVEGNTLTKSAVLLKEKFTEHATKLVILLVYVVHIQMNSTIKFKPRPVNTITQSEHGKEYLRKNLEYIRVLIRVYCPSTPK